MPFAIKKNQLRFFFCKKVFTIISESRPAWKNAFRGRLASYDSMAGSILENIAPAARAIRRTNTSNIALPGNYWNTGILEL